MRRLLLALFLLLWMSLPVDVSAQEGDSTPTPTPTETGQAEQSTPTPGSASIGITSPLPGETLAGSIPISGLITQPGFSLWELSFSFVENPTDNWFLLASGTQTLEGQIANWDTTPLTDGDYALRLRIYFSDAYRDVLVTPVRVRNYSVDTPSPTPTQTATLAGPSLPNATPRPTETATITRTPRSTPTALPPNPAILTNKEIAASLLRGAGYTALSFAIFGLLVWLKTRLTHKQ